jgi:hypothetical protein
MVHFMNQVTDKKDWQTKAGQTSIHATKLTEVTTFTQIYDNSILQKWKAEVMQRGKGDATKGDDDHEGRSEGEEDEGADVHREDGSDQDDGDDGPSFTEGMFKFCIDELRWKADMFKKTGFVSVFYGDAIKSDAAIPADLQAALKATVSPLENIPGSKQDWHPGSDEQVLDLVHPSLFPLVYGLSRILPNSTTNLHDCMKRCGEGEVLPVPTSDVYIEGDRRGYDAYSTRFQWLPCEVDISGDTPK